MSIQGDIRLAPAGATKATQLVDNGRRFTIIKDHAGPVLVSQPGQ